MSASSRERHGSQWRCGVDAAALALEENGGDFDLAGVAASSACVEAGLPALSRRQRRDVVTKAFNILWYFGWRPTVSRKRWSFPALMTTEEAQ